MCNWVRKVLYEQWQEREIPHRRGATTTRRTQWLTLVCLQTINVVSALETFCVEVSNELQASADSFDVTRGPLVPDFAPAASLLCPLLCCFESEKNYLHKQEVHSNTLKKSFTKKW